MKIRGDRVGTGKNDFENGGGDNGSGVGTGENKKKRKGRDKGKQKVGTRTTASMSRKQKQTSTITTTQLPTNESGTSTFESLLNTGYAERVQLRTPSFNELFSDSPGERLTQFCNLGSDTFDASDVNPWKDFVMLFSATAVAAFTIFGYIIASWKFGESEFENDPLAVQDAGEFALALSSGGSNLGLNAAYLFLFIKFVEESLFTHSKALDALANDPKSKILNIAGKSTKMTAAMLSALPPSLLALDSSLGSFEYPIFLITWISLGSIFFQGINNLSRVKGLVPQAVTKKILGLNNLEIAVGRIGDELHQIVIGTLEAAKTNIFSTPLAQRPQTYPHIYDKLEELCKKPKGTITNKKMLKFIFKLLEQGERSIKFEKTFSLNSLTSGVLANASGFFSALSLLGYLINTILRMDTSISGLFGMNMFTVALVIALACNVPFIMQSFISGDDIMRSSYGLLTEFIKTRKVTLPAGLQQHRGLLIGLGIMAVLAAGSSGTTLDLNYEAVFPFFKAISEFFNSQAIYQGGKIVLNGATLVGVPFFNIYPLFFVFSLLGILFSFTRGKPKPTAAEHNVGDVEEGVHETRDEDEDTEFLNQTGRAPAQNNYLEARLHTLFEKLIAAVKKIGPPVLATIIKELKADIFAAIPLGGKLNADNLLRRWGKILYEEKLFDQSTNTEIKQAEKAAKSNRNNTPQTSSSSINNTDPEAEYLPIYGQKCEAFLKEKQIIKSDADLNTLPDLMGIYVKLVNKVVDMKQQAQQEAAEKPEQTSSGNLLSCCGHFNDKHSGARTQQRRYKRMLIQREDGEEMESLLDEAARETFGDNMPTGEKTSSITKCVIS